MEFIEMYKNKLIHRYDEVPYLSYFRYEDFKGLKYEKYEFENKGYKLTGGFYFYDNYKNDNLIVFCHGLGGGYSAYMKEINEIASMGYRVLSFDHIGCCQSEGNDIISINESLANLISCVRSLKSNELYKNKRISVVGHSWGGFAALNILSYVDDIYSVVDISGFISITTGIDAFIEDKYKADALAYEKKMNPDLFDKNIIETLNNTKSKVLIIHDEIDNIIPYASNSKILKENVFNPNVKFVLTNGKYHNPNYAQDAVSYMVEVFTKFQNAGLNDENSQISFFKDVDFNAMTNQDKSLFKEIFETLK